MRALTLTQPWAGLVASGIKLVENRPRKMIKQEDFGVPFAIHASRMIDEPTYDRIYEIAPELRGTFGIEPWSKLSRITSSIIGVATIDKVLAAWDSTSIRQYGHELRFTNGRMLGTEQARWFFGPVGYVLRDVRALKTPIAIKGQLGFWTLPDDVAAQVEAQLAEAA